VLVNESLLDVELKYRKWNTYDTQFFISLIFTENFLDPPLADEDSRRVLLLDNHLSLRRVVIEEHQLNRRQLCSLCYVEQQQENYNNVSRVLR